MITLLSKEHRITEKGMMEFQPFGMEPDGTPIRDLSGVVTRAHVERLEELVSRRDGPEAGRAAVDQFVRLLNERIPDQAYHVTAEFLRNPWNSYSNEFSAYVGEFCVDLSGDPLFAFGMARERAIAHMIQVLGRQLSVQQIYRMSAYFSNLYAKDSFLVEAASVRNGAAVLRMTFGERTHRHFGRYRRRCAFLWCISVKGYFVGVPERFHNLQPAVVKDLQCMADGHDCCEWEVTWSVQSRAWAVAGWLRRRRPAAVLEHANRDLEPASQPTAFNARQALSNEAAPIESAESVRQGVDDRSREGGVATLLSNEHRITEKGMMEFQPFGTEPDGTLIRDLSGVVIRADVDYLEDYVCRTKGEEAARRMPEELVRRLNARIPDAAYHVTTEFLRNPWNSYSAEFAAFCAEFCIALSGDPLFLYNMARQNAISPIITVLGKPFSVPQIYKMSAYFAQRYAKDSFFTDAVEVSEGAAVVQMRLSERTYQKFGPYRRACAEHWCNAHKGYFVGVPEMFHHLPPANVIDRRCIANGDDYCEWKITWSTKDRPGWPMLGWLAQRLLGRELARQQQIIEDQARSLDAWHEELKMTYVQQQQLTAELQRRVDQLTTLHESGLLFTATLDREALIDTVLLTIMEKLKYDRAMLTFYDRARHVQHDVRVLGVPKDVAAFAASLEVPITDPDSVEGTVFLKGESVLVGDIQEVGDRLHSLNRRLAELIGVKSFLSVPLKVKNEVIGALTVNRLREHALTTDDVNLIGTMASQVAIALDNTNAYSQIEALNVGLEANVQERTQELQAANEKLRELDLLKSSFVSMVSHELRTPMTSIKGYVDNLLDGVAGPLNEKPAYYLNRVKHNVERLTRMINDLLDLSRIEAGAVQLQLDTLSIPELLNDVVEGFQTIATERSVNVKAHSLSGLPLIQGDRDKLYQVLNNLIQNAIKFTPKGGAIIAEARAGPPGYVQICVSDTGCGIAPEERGKVFERFYRGESVAIEDRGAGLGLAITKNLVELHHGRIWVESTPGEGSRFFFTLLISQTA